MTFFGPFRLFPNKQKIWCRGLYPMVWIECFSGEKSWMRKVKKSRQETKKEIQIVRKRQLMESKREKQVIGKIRKDFWCIILGCSCMPTPWPKYNDVAFHQSYYQYNEQGSTGWAPRAQSQSLGPEATQNIQFFRSSILLVWKERTTFVELYSRKLVEIWSHQWWSAAYVLVLVAPLGFMCCPTIFCWL